MSDVRQLYDLQGVDLKIGEVGKSLAEVLAKLADESVLTSARAQVQQLESRLDDLESERRGADRTVAVLQDTVKTLDGRLYGGAVTNPQQFAAAEEERNYTSDRLREAEDQLLELMVAIEEAEPALAEAQQSLSRLEARRPVEEAEWRSAESKLRSELASLGREREGMEPLVPATLLPLYDSMRKSRGGHAVAKVERGMCQGCRLVLPTMDLQHVRSGRGVVRCSSCGRILYAD